jgi:uncharacterized protein YecE (DUF72 family)
MIEVGTCSWTEKSLVRSGEFYPREVRTAEERLRFYAEQFSTVEVDSSYYAIPERSVAGLWDMRSPAGFLFHIKVFGALTGHGTDPRTLPPDILAELGVSERQKSRLYIEKPALLRKIGGRLVENLQPLQASDKLGLMVFQFPPWVYYSEQRLQSLLPCSDFIRGLPMAVEFRHGSWFSNGRTKKVLGFLERHNMTHVIADEPQYGTLATVPFVPEVTTDIAYFRLHGRNRDNWLRKGLETSLRYDYLYSEQELHEFERPVLDAARKTANVYVMFNNCHGSSAVNNAREMKKLLKERKK